MQVDINSEFLFDLSNQILVLDSMRWKYIKTMPAARSGNDLLEIKKRERRLRQEATLLKTALTNYLQKLNHD
jgi:hypothetical protein